MIMKSLEEDLNMMCLRPCYQRSPFKNILGEKYFDTPAMTTHELPSHQVLEESTTTDGPAECLSLTVLIHISRPAQYRSFIWSFESGYVAYLVLAVSGFTVTG
jgi:hypothetical protein